MAKDDKKETLSTVRVQKWRKKGEENRKKRCETKGFMVLWWGHMI